MQRPLYCSAFTSPKKKGKEWLKEAQARADKAKPHVEPAAVKRKAEANAIIEAIAKKVKEAAEKAEKQKAQRKSSSAALSPQPAAGALHRSRAKC